MELITIAFIMGIVGNLHCVGMCGPIALAIPVNRENRLTKTLGIVAYNSGRIFTYVLLGAVLGIFGKGFKLAGILQYVSIGIGIIFILSVLLPSVLKKVSFSNRYYLKFNNWIKNKLGYFLTKKSTPALFTLGMLNGLLPCGLVGTALLGAVAYGSILKGALFMAMFGLGTLPAMFLIPYFSGSISMNIRNKMSKAVPYIMVLFGILFILRGMNLDIPYISPPISEGGAEVKSCCHH